MLFRAGVMIDSEVLGSILVANSVLQMVLKMLLQLLLGDFLELFYRVEERPSV